MCFLQRVLPRLRWDWTYIWLLWKQESFCNRLWGTGRHRSHRRVIIICTAVTCCIFTIANLQNSGMSNRDNLSSSHDYVGPCLGHKTGLRGWVNTRVVNICRIPCRRRFLISLYCSSQADFLVASLCSQLAWYSMHSFLVLPLKPLTLHFIDH